MVDDAEGRVPILEAVLKRLSKGLKSKSGSELRG